MAMTRETSGKLIGACGSAATVERLAEGLRAARLEARAFPIVRLEARAGWTAGMDFDSFEWLVLVSPTAAQIALEAIGIYTGKIACIGQSTAKVVKDAGYSVTLTPAEQSRKGLLKELAARASGRLLLPLGDAAPDELVAGLKKARLEVQAPVAYSNVPDERAMHELTAALAAHELAALAFTSSSAVEHAVLAGELDEVRIYCIGPSTEASARELGLEVSGVARQPNVGGLVKLIAGAERG